jgi:hypothetical protein
VFITYALEVGLCVLRRTYREDYETLFHVAILSKHHHHHVSGEWYEDDKGGILECMGYEDPKW